MAHYAFMDENDIVNEVIVGIDETELVEGIPPEEWYAAFRGQKCRRTSYNTYGGIHVGGGVPFRKNYASVGYTWDEQRNAFIPPLPSEPPVKQGHDWVFDEDTCRWVEIQTGPREVVILGDA